MAYATLEQLQKRAGVVYERIYEDGADASDDLAEAAAEIDGCLSKRYIVPVTAEASLQLLKGWNLTLAEERMYARGGAAKLSESDSARIGKVREYLMMAMDGRFILPGAAENPETGGADVSLVDGNTPQFTREKLGGY